MRGIAALTTALSGADTGRREWCHDHDGVGGDFPAQGSDIAPSWLAKAAISSSGHSSLILLSSFTF
jgi:hypothetical protein